MGRGAREGREKGGTTLKGLGILFIVVLILLGLTLYSYARVETKVVSVDGVTPELGIGIDTLLLTAVAYFTGGGTALAAIKSVIDGVNIEATAEVRNRSFLPVYLPKTEHRVSLEGKEGTLAATTAGQWLSPGESITVPVKVLLPTDDIQDIALQVIRQGGEVEVSIDSKFALAGVGVTRSASGQGNVVESLQSLILGRDDVQNTGPTDLSAIATPTSTAAPAPSTTPASGPGVSVRITRLEALDEHEALGAGEIYLLVGVSDGSRVNWTRFPSEDSHYSMLGNESK